MQSSDFSTGAFHSLAQQKAKRKKTVEKKLNNNQTYNNIEENRLKSTHTEWNRTKQN